jgi:hypothetical protein
VPAGPYFIPLQSFLGEFAEMARRAFVTVTPKVFSIAGGKQAISKISVITVLNLNDITAQIKSIRLHSGSHGN